MWGPPASMTMAKPTFIGKVREKNVERWDEIGTGGEKWMACYYGEDGYPDAIMSKRISDSATVCTVTYPKDKNDRRLEIACTW